MVYLKYHLVITEKDIPGLHLMTGENLLPNEKKKVKEAGGEVLEQVLQADGGMRRHQVVLIMVVEHHKVRYVLS